ncbi:MAG: hypothetical protein HC831_11370 [Chloroflexia bacterium]|nr:hypothetical protein [Chloroflexia bacterium]
MVDGEGKIINSMNLDPQKEKDEKYLLEELEEMKYQNEPIQIELSDNQVNYIYYKDSVLLTDLYFLSLPAVLYHSAFFICRLLCSYSFKKSRAKSAMGWNVERNCTPIRYAYFVTFGMGRAFKNARK